MTNETSPLTVSKLAEYQEQIHTITHPLHKYVAKAWLDMYHHKAISLPTYQALINAIARTRDFLDQLENDLPEPITSQDGTTLIGLATEDEYQLLIVNGNLTEIPTKETLSEYAYTIKLTTGDKKYIVAVDSYSEVLEALTVLHELIEAGVYTLVSMSYQTLPETE